jgi:hypothetical protein
MWTYVLNLATTALAAFTLAKDWNAHQNHWRRGIVIGLIILLGGAAVLNTHIANKRATDQQQNADKKHTEDQTQITGLKTAVESANRAQETNTKLFIASFTDMTGKLNGMETQIKTAGLQKESEQLKAELASTRKALSPPRAELESSAGEVTETLENLEVKQAPAQIGVDGTLSFKITVVNKSNVQAKNGSVFVRICVGCSYAEEPARFQKPVGALDQDRQMPFDNIPALTGLAIPLKVKVPSQEHLIKVDVTMRCENCSTGAPDALFIKY